MRGGRWGTKTGKGRERVCVKEDRDSSIDDVRMAGLAEHVRYETKRLSRKNDKTKQEGKWGMWFRMRVYGNVCVCVFVSGRFRPR